MSEPTRTSAVTPWDPGLQNERTGLAWFRSMLALVSAATVFIKLAATADADAEVMLAGTFALLAGVVGLVWAGLRYRQAARRLIADRPLPDGKHLVLMAVATAMVAAVALAIVFA